MDDGRGRIPAGPRVVDRLHRSRRARFVGRDAELGLIRALGSPGTGRTVAFLHGPGGVGKSALLRAAVDEARSSGARVAWVDLRAIEAAPTALCEALGAQLGHSADAVAEGHVGAGRCVLVLDTYEAAGALDHWVRERFVPNLSVDVVVLIAGRHRPAPGWSTDRGWRDLLAVVPVRNLPPADARALLEVEGVPAGLHDRLLDASHGHPLALNLLIDVIGQQGPDAVSLGGLGWVPDVVQPLLERFVAGVPSVAHRDALRACAVARTTNESLLRTVLPTADPSELFAWLCGLSFMEQGARGVFPHDLVRDVLVQDARWRDPDGHARLVRRVHDHLAAAQHAPTGDAHQTATDLVFLHRASPFSSGLWDWRRFGDVYADRLRPGDLDAVLASTLRAEGEEQAALVAHWAHRQPEGFLVFRGADGRLVGFTASVALHLASAEDIEADPGTRAMWAFAQRHAPPRTGEEVHASRFFLDVDAGQSLASSSLNALTVASTQAWLSRQRPSWELLGVSHDPEAMRPLMDYIGFRREPEADYEVAGRHHGVYANDWRRMSPQRWLELMRDREAGQEPGPPAPGVRSSGLTLSQEEFGTAVKRALRDLHRPDALAQSPLAASRVVLDHPDDRPPVEVLGGVIREAIETLATHPRDVRLHRVLDRTFLRPAPSQERAAEVLDLPMSTYRRHLAQGTQRVIDWMWRRELSGWDGPVTGK